MVTMESATTLSWLHSNQLPIEGDHSTIVKFSHAAQNGYKMVATRLKEAMKTAAKATMTLPGMLSFSSLLWQSAAHIKPDELLETRRICRDWLNATEPEAEYENNLRHKADGTCSWVFETSEYRNWREPAQEKENNLWIKGKPGMYLKLCEYNKTIIIGILRRREVSTFCGNHSRSSYIGGRNRALLLLSKWRP